MTTGSFDTQGLEDRSCELCQARSNLVRYTLRGVSSSQAKWLGIKLETTYAGTTLLDLVPDGILVWY
jgi:hypothetical protein